jgi:hypothetical protein
MDSGGSLNGGGIREEYYPQKRNSYPELSDGIRRFPDPRPLAAAFLA